MKRAFTLLELLVVVAIIGILGSAASGAYSAMVRGMKERSALTAASGVLRAAKERAHVDCVPTAVFCCNRLVRRASKTENAVVVGVMTAVRRSGRISYAANPYLFDEFSDLDHTYESTRSEAELRNSAGFRLFYFGGSGKREMAYSVVSDRVMVDDQRLVNLFSGTGNKASQTNILASAFYNLGKSAYEHTWKSGDAYAFEFNEIELPPGMIFGSRIPGSPDRDEVVDVFYFQPWDDNDETIELNSTKPDGGGNPRVFSKVGTASSDNNKAS